MIEHSQQLGGLPGGLIADPALLEALLGISLPVAVLDERLAVLAANASFAGAAGLSSTEVVGARLASLFPAEGGGPGAPPDGLCGEWPSRSSAGDLVCVSLSRSGPLVVAVVRADSSSGSVASEALSAALQEQGRLQRELLAVSRGVAGSATEEELVSAIAQGVKSLFPGTLYCVRILDPKSFALSTLYAEGQLRPGADRKLFLRRSAADKTGLDATVLPSDKVELVDEEVPVFQGSLGGLAVPLAANGQLFGAIHLEYPSHAEGAVCDEPLLIQLANLTAVGIRNARLIEELTFVRQYLEQLIEQANVLIMVVGRGGEVQVFNRAMAELTGLRSAEVIGKPGLSVVAERDRAEVAGVISRAFQGSQVSRHELSLVSLNGKEARVVFNTTLLQGGQGEPLALIAVGQDLTKLRDLEGRIVQAEKLASLGQLAAGVVHEINNPLTTISVAAEALKMSLAFGRGGRAELDWVKKIRESSERILRFARELISYARPAEDRVEEMDLHAVLDQALGYCEHVARESGAQFERRYAEGLPRLRGVRSHLVQVVVNLITNACHALGEGGTITLETAVAGDWAELRVEDNGSGIDPANLPRIFEPFFTTKADGKGTGLGLSIVQGLVVKQGGSIGVQSSQGKGTVFTVRLPISR